MQSNINSLAICILGLAVGFGYYELDRRMSRMHLNLLNESLKVDRDIKMNFQRGTILKEMIEATRKELQKVDAKIDKYLDIENPFNLSAGGDEV
jgi:uncharacterized protein YjcR